MCLGHLPLAVGRRQVLRPTRLGSHPGVTSGLCDFGLVLNFPKPVSTWDHREGDKVDDSTCGHMLSIPSVSMLQWCDWRV